MALPRQFKGQLLGKRIDRGNRVRWRIEAGAELSPNQGLIPGRVVALNDVRIEGDRGRAAADRGRADDLTLGEEAIPGLPAVDVPDDVVDPAGDRASAFGFQALTCPIIPPEFIFC